MGTAIHDVLLGGSTIGSRARILRVAQVVRTRCARAGLAPLPTVVDVTAGFDGAKDPVGIGRYVVYPFDDYFRSATEPHLAVGVKSSGVDVAIDIAPACNIVFQSNLRGTAPTQESGFDFLAIGMTANGAFACVEVWR